MPSQVVYDNKLGWFPGTPSNFFTLDFLCVCYALYPCAILPFYLTLAEPSVRVAKSACREVSRLERQLRIIIVIAIIIIIIIIIIRSRASSGSCMSCHVM